MAMTAAGTVALWITNLLSLLSIAYEMLPKIMVDSASALAIASGKSNLRKDKHVELKYHKIKQWIESKKFETAKVATKENASDFLTKALTRVALEYLCKKVKLRLFSLSGGIENNAELSLSEP